MKRILMAVLVSGILLTLTGCEPKNAGIGRVLPDGGKFQMQIWTADEPEMIQALATEFIADQRTPGLTALVVSFADNEELQGALVDRLAEGKGPDVVYTDGEWIARNTGKLIYVDGDESFTPERFRKTFSLAASDSLVHKEKDGEVVVERIYGVPMVVDSLALVYNEEHTVDRLDSRQEPGNTWAELQQDAVALSRPDNSPERFAVAGVALGRVDNIRRGAAILENIMTQLGVQFFSEDSLEATWGQGIGILPDGKSINTGVEALKLFVGFAQEGKPHYSWNEYMANSDEVLKDFLPFLQGRVSVVFAGARELRGMLDLLDSGKIKKGIPQGNIRVAFFPQLDKPDGVGTRRVVGYVSALVVPRSAKDRTLAWDFLKFAILKENMRSFMEETGLPTPRVDLIPEQELEPRMGIWARQAKFARANVYPVRQKDVLNALGTAVELVHAGARNLRMVLTQASAEISDGLRRKARRDKLLK